MEAVEQSMKGRPSGGRLSYQEIRQEVLKDAEVAQFISDHQMTTDQIERSMTKFLEFISERQKYQTSAQDVIAEGYQPILIMNEGYADVAYLETERLLAVRAQEKIKERIQLIGLPKSLKGIATQDLDLTDENRMEVYAAINQFVDQYAQGKHRGLYLYGNFGVGKSYIMAYLAYLLSQTHQLQTTMLHYPTFVVDIKNAIKDASVKEKIDEIKGSPVLILDDIGAEQHSSWVRDDVLQVILQHRMQENLPTFFTSNFDLSDLERHFANGKSGDETWQSQRVMERVRFLAQEMQLKGVNRRHERNH